MHQHRTWGWPGASLTPRKHHTWQTRDIQPVLTVTSRGSHRRRAPRKKEKKAEGKSSGLKRQGQVKQGGSPTQRAARERWRRPGRSGRRSHAADARPPRTAASAARARRCAAVAHATLDALELSPSSGAPRVVGSDGAAGAVGSSEGLLPVVCMHWAEAQEHCAYRWEREMEMMLDLTSGRARSSGAAAHLEDQLLRVLLDERRQLAEQALHTAKGNTQTDDMHFESYFYSEVDFGLPEQAHARRDPNRLTYAQHGLTDFDPARVTASLHDRYTPRAICDIVRRKVLDSTEAAATEMREKLIDWLGAHIPAGMLPRSPMAERRSTWLHTYCHDAEYRMTEPALLLALCGMRVLRVEWPSASSASSAAGAAEVARALGRAPRDERDGVRELAAALPVTMQMGGSQPDAPPRADFEQRSGSAGLVLACCVLVVAIVPNLLLRAGWLPSFE